MPRNARIDALLASQVITQKGSDIKNFTALSELLEAEGMRDRRRLDLRRSARHQPLASELGYDAGFGRGTLPSEVAALYRGYAGRTSRRAAVKVEGRRCRKTALVTGITGQDGSYLAELLLEKGYRVVGMTRRTSTEVHERIEHIVDDVEIVSGDLLDQSSITSIVNDVRPDEILQSRGAVVRAGVLEPAGAHRRVHGAGRDPRAGGDPPRRSVDPLLPGLELRDVRQRRARRRRRETTPFYPRSPYGVAKVYGHWITVNYRESYGLYACSGICFNHESPRRGKEFVTRKISDGVARIKLGLASELRLGNLDAHRDWGFAGDYVRAMWVMLQQDEPDDYVIATGRTHSVRDFVRIAFEAAGLGSYEPYVVIDPRFVRPAEVDRLIGDPSKARSRLGWVPQMSFEELVADDGRGRSRPALGAPAGVSSESELASAGNRRQRFCRRPFGRSAAA